MSCPTRIASYAAAALAALLCASAQAQQNTRPGSLPDDTYVTLSGRVGDRVGNDEFDLRYGGGIIRVDTNDTWPNLFSKDAAEVLRPGDRITVTGLVDDNLFAAKEIDASSITHQGKTYTRVYLQPTVEGHVPYYSWDQQRTDDNVSLSGVVSSVTGNDEFQMRYGNSTLKVDTSQLDLLDSDPIRAGDRVTVYGDLDNNWFGKRELEADYLVRVHSYQPRG